MSPTAPLTPPHTPAASLTPSSSIPSTDTEPDLDNDSDPTRFLLVTHVPRDAHSESIKRVFTDLIHPHTSTDPIHGIFVALQKSEGRIVIAFFDSRDAAAVVTAATEADAPFRLAALLGGSPPPGVECRFVSVTELEQLTGKTTRVTNHHGSFFLSLESTTATQPDAESHARVKAFLDQCGDVRTFAFANEPPQVDPNMNIIHVEFYDIRNARKASTAINGRVIAGCKICVFGQPADSDEALNGETQRSEEGALTTKQNAAPFPSEAAGSDGDGDGCETTQNPIVKQRPRSASTGTNATDLGRHALRPISPVFTPSFPHNSSATGPTDPPSNRHSRNVHGPAQIHDVFGRRCSNQLLFDAARRTVVPQPNSEPERSRRSLSNGAWQSGEGPDLEQAVKDREEGWIGVDDSYAGPLLAHAHPYAYASQQHSPQYYFPPIGCLSPSDVVAEAHHGAYLQQPSSFYGLSPSLQFAPPPPGQMSLQPMTFTGYEYEVHPANLGVHASAGTRTGRPSSAGPGWGLDHTMAQEYWYGNMMRAAGYYPATHQQPHSMRQHHVHPAQQLVHPYTLRGGHPHLHFGPESFGGYAYPPVPCASSPMPLQSVAAGMGGGPGQLQGSVQMPGADITSMPAPVRTEVNRMPSPNRERNVGATKSAGINASTNVAAAATGIDRNQLNLARIADGQDTRTTVMIKNIPNKMSDTDLLDYIWRVCPRRIDFLYLRIDFHNECNVGYAFVNFISVEDLLKFVKARLDVKWNMFSSEKVLHMSYANYQGKEALIEKFKNSCIMDEREAWRPKIFYSEPGPNQGLREPFPPPTHFRRKERSSHNRGALFVPNLMGGSNRQDRYHGTSSGQGFKRRQQGTASHGAALEQLQYPNQSQRGQHNFCNDESDKLICERRDPGENGSYLRDGRGYHVPEARRQQPDLAVLVGSGPLASRYAKSEHRRSSK